MKKILIYDVAAEKTGAAAVLKQYYDNYSSDETVETYVVTSVLDFPGNEHTHIIQLPWTKKSRIHRLYCDHYYIHKLVRRYHIDELINLQNIAIKGLNISQTLYLHNAIPISDIDFDFVKERSLWLFKHIISKMILNNLKYADKIIVQAEWIKSELAEKCGVSSSVVQVERVTPAGFEKNPNRIITERAIFFYPANACSYKNHACLIAACEQIKNSGIENYEVILTLDPNTDGREYQKLIEEKKLPIKLVGLLNNQQMEDYYRKSILLFPSYLETVGLPLIEAQLFDSEIIAADLPYAREAVGAYKTVRWFDYRKPLELSNIMKDYIQRFQ